MFRGGDALHQRLGAKARSGRFRDFEENDYVRLWPAGDSTPFKLTRMFHEADFAGSLLFRGLNFVDLARV